jgi:hypothetical protein
LRVWNAISTAASLAAERSLYRRFEIVVREGDPLRVHAPPEIACSPARVRRRRARQEVAAASLP